MLSFRLIIRAFGILLAVIALIRLIKRCFMVHFDYY